MSTFGYFRRIFGNFQVLNQNLRVKPTDFTQFSITAPLDPRLPGGGGYMINGLYNLNPRRATWSPPTPRSRARLGEQIEHWNGVDLSINARFQHGVLVQGGFSAGRTSTDNCAVVAQPHPGDQSVLGTRRPYCHVDTNLMGQTQVKLLGTYMMPKMDINFAATFQSVPGPANLGKLHGPQRGHSAVARAPAVGRARRRQREPDAAGHAVWRTRQPARLARSRRFQVRDAPGDGNLDIYNTLNASPVLQENAAYATWRVPQRIMDGRLYKLSVQVDF